MAEAAVQGYSTANVNMRSGPSTAYPAVTVIPVGAPVTINGCMSSVNWCDVSFVGGRGWVSGNYVQAAYQSNRVYVAPDYYQGLGIPTVTFEVDNYWDRYYRGRDFYRDRDRWRRYDWHADRPLPPPPPRWDDRRPPGPPPGWDRNRDRWEQNRDRWDQNRNRWEQNRDRWEQNRDRNDDRRPPPRGEARPDRGDDRRPPPGMAPDRGRGDDRRPPPRVDRGDDRRPPPRAEQGGDRRPPPGDNGRPQRAEQRPLGTPPNDTDRRCLPGQCGN
jgi:uncharacterized protein YraI